MWEQIGQEALNNVQISLTALSLLWFLCYFYQTWVQVFDIIEKLGISIFRKDNKPEIEFWWLMVGFEASGHKYKLTIFYDNCDGDGG